MGISKLLNFFLSKFFVTTNLCYPSQYKLSDIRISSYDADVNALSDCDDTPLHDAVSSGNEKANFNISFLVNFELDFSVWIASFF